MKYKPSSSQFTSSTDHIHTVSCNSIARGVVLAGDCKQYITSGNMLIGAKSYESLLQVTRGYFNTRPCCNLVHTDALSLSDGRFSAGTRPAIHREKCSEPKKKKQPRPKPTKHCLPECKKRHSDPEHFCFEMDDDYGSYSMCEKDDPARSLDKAECSCYESAGVIFPAGTMNKPRRERLFRFPAPKLELSSACGELDACRKFEYEQCVCRYCGDSVEVIIPDGCGFITLKHHPAQRDNMKQEPHDVDGKFECYSRTCVSLCPHPRGYCKHPRCKDGHHHRPDCGLDCRKLLADVVCERKECFELHEKKDRKCFTPALCQPCDKRHCSEKRCVDGYHHHHVCKIKNCPHLAQDRSYRKTGSQLPIPGQHIHTLSILGFQQNSKPTAAFGDSQSRPLKEFKKRHEEKRGENCGPHCACCRNERQRRPHT